MKSALRGFTLIELMIVVALVSILAAVALPGYREHVRKSRRAEAQSYLLSVASRQQQFLVDTRSYSASLTDIGIAAPSSVSAAYDITLCADSASACAAPAQTFYLKATPKSDQTSERCGTLTIDQNGTKTPTSGTCW